MLNRLIATALNIQSAKSGSDWTRNELEAYNIKIVMDEVAAFFGNPNLPPPSVSQAILINENYPSWQFTRQGQPTFL